MKRSSQQETQHEGEAVRLALMKAREMRWLQIKISSVNKHPIALIKSGIGDDTYMVILVEDIIALANLFQLYSFCVGNSNSINHCNRFSFYALSTLRDEERTVAFP